MPLNYIQYRQEREITRSLANKIKRVREKERQKEKWSSDHRNAEAESVQPFSNARQSHPQKQSRADLQDYTVTAVSINLNFKIWFTRTLYFMKEISQWLV